KGISIRNSKNTTLAENSLLYNNASCGYAMGCEAYVHGISLTNVSDSLISKNALGPNYVACTGNLCVKSSYGLILHNSSKNTLYNNTINSNHYGIAVGFTSIDNQINNNDFISNQYGLKRKQ
ncbi:MAG: NosD domain-containing protein, partial [Candidatus Nanoarchaeia archaeon]